MTAAWKGLAVIAVLLSSLSLLAGVLLYQRIQTQRGDSIELLCDINDVLREFVKAPPDRPRDRPALRRLDAEGCDELLDDLGRRPAEKGGRR